ncbi:hypothetical protein Ancab_025549, partial [Ancistrocladus abbreviatus]
ANNDALLEQAREILKARVERKDVMGGDKEKKKYINILWLHAIGIRISISDDGDQVPRGSPGLA